MRRAGRRGLWAMLTAALLTACTMPWQPPPVTTYVLEWPAQLQFAPPAAAPAALDLLMSVPQSAPGYATPRMAYVSQTHRLDYFAENQWADIPARMLAPLMHRAVEESGLVASVALAPAPLNADLRLDSQLLELQQVFEKNGSYVQLILQVTLFDLHERRLLGTRVFKLREEAPEETPYGGVVAANRALETLLVELVGFMAEQLAVPLPDTGQNPAAQ